MRPRGPDGGEDDADDLVRNSSDREGSVLRCSVRGFELAKFELDRLQVAERERFLATRFVNFVR